MAKHIICTSDMLHISTLNSHRKDFHFSDKELLQETTTYLSIKNSILITLMYVYLLYTDRCMYILHPNH